MKIYIRKDGNVGTVFLDERGMPTPFNDYENPPETAFPWAASIAELKAKFPGSEIVYIEKQRPPQPEVKRNAQVEAKLEQEYAAIRADAEAKGLKPLPAPVSPIPVLTAPPPVPMQMNDRIVASLQLRFARYGEATGKRKVQLKMELEAVASFLLEIDPSYAPVLEQMKAQLDQPKFSL